MHFRNQPVLIGRGEARFRNQSVGVPLRAGRRPDRLPTQCRVVRSSTVTWPGSVGIDGAIQMQCRPQPPIQRPRNCNGGSRGRSGWAFPGATPGGWGKESSVGGRVPACAARIDFPLSRAALAEKEVRRSGRSRIGRRPMTKVGRDAETHEIPGVFIPATGRRRTPASSRRSPRFRVAHRENERRRRVDWPLSSSASP